MMALGMLLPVLVVGFITMSILEERKRNRNKKKDKKLLSE